MEKAKKGPGNLIPPKGPASNNALGPRMAKTPYLSEGVMKSTKYYK